MITILDLILEEGSPLKNTLYLEEGVESSKVEFHHAPPMSPTRDTLYEWNDILDHLIQGTACFGTHSKRAKECERCPIREQCLIKKEGVQSKAKAVKLSKASLEEKAKDVGFTLKGIRIPAKINLDIYDTYSCKSEDGVDCIISKKKINKGEPFYHFKGWGVLHPSCLEILKDLRKLKRK